VVRTDLNKLQAEYPQWHIRCTLSGTRIATRLDKLDLTDIEQRKGLVMTLMVDDWSVMSAELAKQAQLESSLQARS
jgi:hypothetical protein